MQTQQQCTVGTDMSTCPVCLLSSVQSTTIARLIRDSARQMPNLPILVENARRDDTYLCQPSFIMQYVPSGFSWDEAIKVFEKHGGKPVRLHPPYAILNDYCFWCQTRDRPSQFDEFKSLARSGKSIAFGDPSVHCTMRDIRWCQIYDRYGECIPDTDQVMPIHAGCVADLRAHGRGMPMDGRD